MGLDLVLLDLLHRSLRPPRSHPPPLPPPHQPSPPRSSGPHPRSPLSVNGALLGRHFLGNSDIVLLRNQGDPLVLAPKQDDSAAVAAVFPPGNQAHWPSLLLVLLVLSVEVSSHAADFLLDSEAEESRPGSAVQPLGAALHVVPLAGILAELSGGGDSVGDAGSRGGVRVQVLGRSRAAGGSGTGELLSGGAGVSGWASGMQFGGPSGILVASLWERGLQRARGLGVQLGPQWGPACALLELLREEGDGEEEGVGY